MSNDFDQDYVGVKDRMSEFRAKHPEGSLRRSGDLEWVRDANGNVIGVAYTAEAFRSPADTMPGQGTGWCEFPGTTEFTRGSEPQNAETSAWGRAIVAALAADTSRGISANHQTPAPSGGPGVALSHEKLVAFASSLRGAGPVEALWAAIAGAPQATRDAVAAVATAKRKAATVRKAPAARKAGPKRAAKSPRAARPAVPATVVVA